jgi:asparagine synthase (glutamine-hydrolysing)
MRVAALSRLLGTWGERSAADLFWVWPGFQDVERNGLYLPSFRAQLKESNPSAYCNAAFERGDGLDDVDRGLQVILETYLPDDLLVIVDIASMASSLEARSPLLDYRVLEFAASLPPSLKLRGFRTKHILKKMAAWLRGPLRRPLEVLLGHPRFVRRGYFDQAAVRSLIARHMAGEDQSSKLWAHLWLELWFRMFVDGDLGRQDSLHDPIN